MTSLLCLLLFPRGEHFGFTFRRRTRAQLRLSILRKRFEPRERVARGVRKRTKCYAFAQRAADACPREPAFSSGPDRHVRTRFHFLLGEKFFVYPREGRVRFLRLLNLIKHSANPERFGRPGRIVNSSLAIFVHGNRTLVQHAPVDKLDRDSRTSLCLLFAPAIDPYRPVSEPIGFIARTDN